MEQPVFRKPRQFFDTAQRPSHVTFDDGKHERLNFPWAHYVRGQWHYSEPETIKLTIGDWLVVIIGHRMEVLYRAIADHTLAGVCAHPEFAGDVDHDADSFATEIRFLQVPAPAKRKGQIELDLGIE